MTFGNRAICVKQRGIFDRHSDIVAVAGRAVSINADGVVKRVQSDLPGAGPRINAHLRGGHPFQHSAWVCRRATLDTAGWYRPMSGMADWDVYLRVAAVGDQAVIKPYTLRKRVHDAQMAKFVLPVEQQATLRWFLTERNRQGGMGWTDAEMDVITRPGARREDWPAVVSFYTKMCDRPGVYRAAAYMFLRRWWEGVRNGGVSPFGVAAVLTRPRLLAGMLILGLRYGPWNKISSARARRRYAR